MLPELLSAILEQAPINHEIIETPQKPRIELLASNLDNPRKLTFGPYISNKGFIAGQREVLQINPQNNNAFSPEPVYDQVRQYTSAGSPPMAIRQMCITQFCQAQVPINYRLRSCYRALW
ncbi:MAG: hypothetical protein KME19_15370 [Microcoleus vaginatus WJT46-NPBG5]|jgi:hypothetical protein|nr:hypothetical protein [Microcoleus vaginatus WJT46-NPBG5]